MPTDQDLRPHGAYIDSFLQLTPLLISCYGAVLCGRGDWPQVVLTGSVARVLGYDVVRDARQPPRVALQAAAE